MPKRYPLRTVLLMIVALAAFGRLWCLTHPPQVPDQTVTTPAEPVRPPPPSTPPTPPPGPPSLEAPADAAPSGATGPQGDNEASGTPAGGADEAASMDEAAPAPMPAGEGR